MQGILSAVTASSAILKSSAINLWRNYKGPDYSWESIEENLRIAKTCPEYLQVWRTILNRPNDLDSDWYQLTLVSRDFASRLSTCPPLGISEKSQRELEALSDEASLDTLKLVDDSKYVFTPKSSKAFNALAVQAIADDALKLACPSIAFTW